MSPPPYLWIYLTYLCTAMIILVVWGAAAALKKTGRGQNEIRRATVLVGLHLFGWLGTVALLGWLGLFAPASNQVIPYIGLAIVIPIVWGALLIKRSRLVETIIRATPQGWLVGVQCYRGAGAIFLILYGMQLLPGVFALPAGVGDVLVGLLALPVAAVYWSGARYRNLAVVAWNALGILDLMVAVGLGFLSAPTPFQLLARTAPNALIGAAPLALIPTFAVPLSIILHGVSLTKVTRDRAVEVEMGAARAA